MAGRAPESGVRVERSDGPGGRVGRAAVAGWSSRMGRVGRPDWPGLIQRVLKEYPEGTDIKYVWLAPDATKASRPVPDLFSSVERKPSTVRDASTGRARVTTRPLRGPAFGRV